MAEDNNDQQHHDGSPEGHNDKMQQKADNLIDGKPNPNNTDDEGNKPELPEWLPEKFAITNEDGTVNYKESAKKVSESYAELERTKQQNADDGDDDAGDDNQSEDGDDDQQVQGVIAKAGLDDDQLWDEIRETGDLSEESYKALEEKAGIDRDLVKSYVNGVKAQEVQYTAAVHQLAGGSEAYETMTAWAAENLDQEDIEAFNTALEEGGETAEKAVNDLKSSYEKANGKAPNLVGGKRPDKSIEGFSSRAEVTKAMKDPRYKNDPAYRDWVYKKLESTDNF